jgi:hypothetical protein
MEEPKTKKDIQKLNGRVAALNRFSSKFAKRSLPFFNALKGKGTIKWAPSKAKPSPSSRSTSRRWQYSHHPRSEPLLLYVAASKAAVSADLVREVEAEKGKL